MHCDDVYQSVRQLLSSLVGEERAGELADRFGEAFGTLPVMLETIGVGKSGADLPETARFLLSMVPGLYQACALEKIGEAPLIDRLSRAGEYAQYQYINAQYECVKLLCLNREYRLIECCTMGEGGIKEVSFYPRKLLLDAIRTKAHAVVLCHNHPSDWPFFSEQDINATRELVDAFSQAGIAILDHLLVAGNHLNSMRSRAYIPETAWMRSGAGMLPLAQWRAGMGPGTGRTHEHFNNTTQIP